MRRKHISVLIVDDEPEARDLLEMLLTGITGVEVTGMAEGVDPAWEMMIRQRPDLVLLDIQMPEKNGFDLVSMVQKHQLETGFIFVTAYDEFAIDAIRASAFDYLLKPVDKDELVDSIQRFREQQTRSNLEQLGILLEEMKKIPKIKVNTRTGFILIDPGEVIHCRAAGNYTEVYMLSDRVEMITSNLGNFTEQLPADRFFRISRSDIINLDYLSRVDYKTGTCRMNTGNGIVLKVPRNRRKALDEIWRSK